MGVSEYKGREMSSLIHLQIPDAICFWDFQDHERDDLTSVGRARYRFEEMNGPIERG
jgi:hypothetical protein